MTGARRVVVKVGSSSLTTAAGGLDADRVDALVDVLAKAPRRRRARRSCWSPPVRSPPGSPRSGWPAGPRDLARQQAAASVGQGLLVARYTASFARYGVRVGQVLLTTDDVSPPRPLPQRLPHPGPAAGDGRAAGRQRERHGRHRRDPLRRQRPARRARRPPGARRPAGAALRRGRALRRRPAQAGRPPDRRGDRAGGPRQGSRSAAPAGPGSAPAGWSPRSRRPGSPPPPGIPVVLTSAAHAADALAGRPTGTLFHRTGKRSADRLLWLAHASTPRGALRLDAGRGPGGGRAAQPRCCPPG